MLPPPSTLWRRFAFAPTHQAGNDQSPFVLQEFRDHPTSNLRLLPQRGIHLVVNLSPLRGNFRCADTQWTRRLPRGLLTVVPMGETASVDWQGLASTFHVHLSPELMTEIALDLNRPGLISQVRAFAGLAPAQLVESLRALRDCLLSPDPPELLLAEQWASELGVTLLTGNHDQGTTPRSGRIGINAIQLRRLTEFVLDRLQQKITIQQMAAELGMSRTHFIRLFRSGTGTSPYAFVLHQRIRCAGALLRKAGLDHDLSAVATLSGFADQSHMNRHFRRSFGITPGQWRDFGRRSISLPQKLVSDQAGRRSTL